MSTIIRLHVKYNLVLQITELKAMMDLVSFINQSDPEQWTGSYIENNERWLWADVNTRSPEINKELIFAVVFSFNGKVFNYPFFVSMEYNRLFQPVPIELPNSIKTYTNLVNWNGDISTMPEDKGDPIYKNWIEYFEGTNNQIMCNPDKTVAYINSNLWATFEEAAIIKLLVTNNYSILDTEEYLILHQNCDIWNYELSVEEIIDFRENCINLKTT